MIFDRLENKEMYTIFKEKKTGYGVWAVIPELE